MIIREVCSCGASVEADDQPFVLKSNHGSDRDSIDRGAKRYQDGSGTGYAADFVERWRDQHVCPTEEPKAVPHA